MIELPLLLALVLPSAASRPAEPAPEPMARVEIVLAPHAAMPAQAPLVTISLWSDRPGAKPVQRRVPAAKGPQMFDLPEGLWEIAASAEGLWAPAEKFVLVKGTAHHLEVGLYRAARLHGSIEVERGDSLPTELGIEVFHPFSGPGPGNPRPKPIATDTVSVRCPVTARTFECVGPAGTWDLKVRAHQHIAHYLWSQKLSPGAPLSLGTLFLRRGASVVGWVSSDAVAPPGDRYRVVLKPLLAMSGTAEAIDRQLSASTEANSHGFFELQGVTPGTYKILATLGTAASAEFFPVRVFPSGETSLQQPLVLAAAATLKVQVSPPTDLEHRPWRVEVSKMGQTPGYQEKPLAAKLRQGSWQLSNVAPGEFEVTVRDGEGSPWAWQIVAVPGTSEVFVDLDFVKVRGVVTLGGEPLAATLFFGGEHGVPHHKLVSDDKGRFDGYLSREGTFPVDVKSLDPLLVKSLRRVEVRRRSGVAMLRLDLPDARISGRVTDEEGQPVARAQVTVNAASEWATLTTGSDGEFTGRGLVSGPATVQARGQGMESAAAWVQLDEKAGAPPVHLVLQKNQTAEGWVLSAAGPVAGAQLLATAAGGIDGSASTDLTGHFTLSVPAAATTLDVEIMAPGYCLQARRVQLGSEDLRFLLETDCGTLILDPAVDYDKVIVEQNGVAFSAGSLAQWAFGNGWRPPSSGQIQLQVPLVEAGQYLACRVSFPQARAFEAGNRSLGSCASGSLAIGGTLSLKFPPR